MSDGITLEEMIDANEGEAWRIEIMQHALVEAGLRAHPHAEQMRRVKAFDTSAQILRVIRADPDLAKKLRERVARASAQRVPRPLAAG